jgi:hypothetical protein
MNTNTFKKILQLTKIDEGKREIEGIISAESPDKENEVLDYASSKPAFQEWSAGIEKATNGKSLGNIRVMHGLLACGKIVALDFNDSLKTIRMRGRIIDDDSWRKCLEGIYSGLSIGGAYTKTWRGADGYTHYTPKIAEVSIVDNPALPDATFSLVRADGRIELCKFSEAPRRNPPKRATPVPSDKEIDDYIDKWIPKAKPVAAAKTVPAPSVAKSITPNPSPKPSAKPAMIKGPLSAQGGPIERMMENRQATLGQETEINASALNESPIFGGLAQVGIVGVGNFQPRQVDASGSMETLDASILDRKAAEGFVEKMNRESRESFGAGLNAAALGTSAVFSGMAKAGKVKAGASRDDQLIGQLRKAVETETTVIGRKFLRAVIAELNKKVS